MGHLYHGYVSHNQRVIEEGKLTWLLLSLGDNLIPVLDLPVPSHEQKDQPKMCVASKSIRHTEYFGLIQHGPDKINHIQMEPLKKLPGQRPARIDFLQSMLTGSAHILCFSTHSSIIKLSENFALLIYLLTPRNTKDTATCCLFGLEMTYPSKIGIFHHFHQARSKV